MDTKCRRPQPWHASRGGTYEPGAASGADRLTPSRSESRAAAMLTPAAEVGLDGSSCSSSFDSQALFDRMMSRNEELSGEN